MKVNYKDQEAVVESKVEVVKRSIEFDDETNKAYMTTEDGIEIEVSCPKTRQLMNVRKLIKKYEPDSEGDTEIMARLFSVACVTKFGTKTSMTYDEYCDLSMGDGLLLAKCLEYFQSEFNQLQHLV